jgi:hypothetical protein
VSAGTKLTAAKRRIQELELELAAAREANAGGDGARARSLLRQILPYVRHKTDCNSRNRGGGEECNCELDDVRDRIEDLLER